MKRSRTSRGMIFVGVGVALSGVIISACGDDRDAFKGREEPTPFETQEAGVDAPKCGLQCSIDGRKVIENCTGTVTEECPAHLACGAGKCIEPCAAAAEDRSSNGCEFYFQPPRFLQQVPPSCYASYVVNTSLQPVDLSLELEGKALDLSKAVYRTNPGSAELVPHSGPVPPGESVVVFISNASPRMVDLHEWGANYVGCPEGVVPAHYDEELRGGTQLGSSFHLKTSLPVATTTIYPFGGAKSFIPTATLVLPVATWGTEHIVVNGWEAAENGGPAAQIIASEDDTEVTIIPTRDIQNGADVVGGLAKHPAKFKLARGQYLQIVQDDELSGSIVTSSKPTTIVGGHACGDIPATAAACDILAQQIPPFAQWGSEYVGVGYRPRLGSEREAVLYRIVAARDGTLLDYDPAIPDGAPTSMKAGEVAIFARGTGDAFVVRTQDADHAIYVSAHMTGANGDGASANNFGDRGDPEFVNVVPAGQYLSSYGFYADPTYGETSLVIVRAKAGGKFEDVWLECAGDLTGWKPVGTRGDYEFLRVDLSRGGGPGDKFDAGVCQHGLQRMRSDGPFTATIWGWDRYASYAYPGGMATRKLVDAPLVPIK